MRLFVLTCWLTLCLGSAMAADDGGTQSPFSMGAGARDLSLGGASLAAGDMVTAPYWNPSRLALAERFYLGGFHSRLYESDVAYQYLGAVMPTLDFGSFGIGVFRLGIDGIEKRDVNNVPSPESIDDNRMAFYLAYARTVAGYNLGLAATMEYHSLDSYSSTSSPGFNVSVSRRFTPGPAWFDHLTLAASGRNILSPKMELVQEQISLPLAADFAATMGIRPKANWDQNLQWSVAVHTAEHTDAELAAGLEYNFGDLLSLRGGVRDEKLSFGAGIQYHGLRFDYALVDRELGSLHMFNLISAFGRSASEKRADRRLRREVEFNSMMSERLSANNRQMVEQIVVRADSCLGEGDLPQAVNLYDRALFLARGNGVDTLWIQDAATGARERLEEARHYERYSLYMDSAQATFSRGEYLEARYYGNLARTELPEAKEPVDLIDKATAAIDESTARQDMIQQRLWVADSLLSFGQTEAALTILTTLSQFAPEESGVKLALKRAELERWRRIAAEAYGVEDFAAAMAALDSALTVFPGHQWFLDLRQRIEENRRQVEAPVIVEELPEAEPLSGELLKEVAATYRAAQEAFEEGDLGRAIAGWEKVERMAPNYQSVRAYLLNAYKFVGVEQYGQNELEQAVVTWKKAAHLDPENGEIRNYIDRTENELRRLRELSYEP